MVSRQRGSSDGVKAGLPRPGSNGLGREHPDGRERISEVQRARMLAAMAEEVSERGVANTTVAHVVACSGVSRRTFYEVFDDREDCFLAAFDDAIERIATIVVPAYRQPGPWRVRIRAALTALLECLDNDRATGRLLVVESLAAGPDALDRRRGVLAQIVPIIDQGRSEGKASSAGPPPLTAEGVAGGVLSILHARLAEKHPGSLLMLTSPLMGTIVLPYLGPAAARRETEQPTPERRAKSPLAQRDPLHDLQMRLTYRTIRVLSAVAAHPRSSNRAIAHAAGIADQGQISKLLARLHRLGLIENTGAGSARGEPNAWALTETGREVEGAIAGPTMRS